MPSSALEKLYLEDTDRSVEKTALAGNVQRIFPNGAELASDTASFNGSRGRTGRTSAESLYRIVGKRAFDLALAVLMLPLLLPVILMLGIGVWAHDRGNPFFVHRRVGYDNRIFGCMKLRTMVVDAERRLAELLATDKAAAEEWAETQKLNDDPRVTRYGRFLRKTSLDELPQLFNVLRGEMSFVGPRPVVPDELLRYGVHAENYARVRPGITGPWQATGRNDLSYPERVKLDVEYERTHTFVGDVKIILMTARAVFKGTGK